MNLNIRELEVFFLAMRSETLTAAAAALHTSQPTVSRTLSSLERRIGLTLFDRRKGQVSPTPEAIALFEELERSYVGLERISVRVQDIKTRRNRGLNLGCYPALSQVFLPEVIAKFTRSHPDFSASIEVSGPIEARRMMERGEIDILICNEMQSHGDLIKMPLVTARFLCILPGGHPLAEKEVITLDDLRHERLIALDADPDLNWEGHQKIFAQFDQPTRFDFHVKRSAIAYSLVAQGLGISILEPFSAAHWRSFGVVTRPFVPELMYNYCIYLPRDRIASRFLDDFIVALRLHCQSLGV